MKRIAIVFEGSIYNRKGLVNAVLERAKRLCEVKEFSVDVYCMMYYENLIVRTLRHTSRIEKLTEEFVNGVKINILWDDFSLIDYILTVKFHLRDIFKNRWLKSIVAIFKDYDLILAHSYTAGVLALNVKKIYNIPYCITWHGSDIHTSPKNNRNIKKSTKEIIDNANVNFFVSKALLETAKSISTVTDKWKISYNGASDLFKKYTDDERQQLRQQYNVLNRKIVAFVGSLVDIKNVLLLPDIVCSVNKKMNSNVILWIIGDGKLRKPLQHKLDEYNIEYKMWGNQSEEKIPLLMNCIDVLILPSKNEGLPLVSVEALRCCVNVVGSNVGGISEVIGIENVFDLNDNFVENISDRIVTMLNNKIKQSTSDVFTWSNTVKKEIEIYGI